MATTARLNNALRRLGAGWALFVEAERRPAADYPHSDFPEPLSWLVDEERRATFEESGEHFESGYHLTLQYLSLIHICWRFDAARMKCAMCRTSPTSWSTLKVRWSAATIGKRPATRC